MYMTDIMVGEYQRGNRDTFRDVMKPRELNDKRLEAVAEDQSIMTFKWMPETTFDGVDIEFKTKVGF